MGHIEYVIVHKLFRYNHIEVLKSNYQQNVHRYARLHVSLSE